LMVGITSRAAHQLPSNRAPGASISNRERQCYWQL
jgi:hypothetical protein